MGEENYAPYATTPTSPASVMAYPRDRAPVRFEQAIIQRSEPLRGLLKDEPMIAFSPASPAIDPWLIHALVTDQWPGLTTLLNRVARLKPPGSR